MTHGRKPRRPRPIIADTFRRARDNAVRLSEAEVQDTMAPARVCLRRLREGTATEDQHTVLASQIMVAIEIERGGIVRGLHEHLGAAMQALASIRARALASGAWRPTALYFHELDALREAVALHEFQLRQLSAGELAAAAKKLIARTRGSGGEVLRTSLAQVAA